jgi:beta-lactam-binding protein with PASTA domain
VLVAPEPPTPPEPQPDGPLATVTAKRGHRGRWMAGLVVLVVAVLVAAGVVYASRPAPVSTFAMPNARGLAVTAVEARLASHHLTIDQSLEPSRTVPAGDVIAQRPAPGVRIRNGSAVALVASAGPPPVELPSLLVAYSPTVPAGDAIAVYDGSVANPASAAYGSSLELALSKGPPPEPIPSIVGLSGSAATAALQRAGFVEVVRDAYSNTVPAGDVVTTEPSPKDLLQPGQRVHVVISLGPPVTVPMLGHVSLAQAERELVDADLTVLAVHGPTSSDEWTCRPAPGSTVAKGSGVTLIAG